MKTVYISTIIALIALSLLWFFTHSVEDVLLAIVLCILEVSLSFDNAVVNAKILQDMDPIWQKRFIYYGIPIAVFGMRLVFPIVLVALTTPLDTVQVIQIALNDPKAYQTALLHGYPMISGFGGAFLLSVFLNFFLDHEREVKWIGWLESNKLVNKIAHIPGVALIVCLGIGAVLSAIVGTVEFAVAFALGAGLNFGLHSIQSQFNSKSIRGAGKKLLSHGLMGFIYLELLDASFSMDGVIGAFAITFNIIIIMIGLGIGAFFVRSFTILMVEHKTLKKWLYLEHGAHYAILFLAAVMFFNLITHVPELITAGVSVIILCVAAYCSKR